MDSGEFGAGRGEGAGHPSAGSAQFNDLRLCLGEGTRWRVCSLPGRRTAATPSSGWSRCWSPQRLRWCRTLCPSRRSCTSTGRSARVSGLPAGCSLHLRDYRTKSFSLLKHCCRRILTDSVIVLGWGCENVHYLNIISKKVCFYSCDSCS